MYHIVIDPEYKSLIPALRQQEFEDLTQALLRDGCREPLSVMEDVDENGDVFYVLIDGHNRHEICEAHGLPYETQTITGLMSREEVRQWIIQNQLGRRNLTEEQVAYYRGEQYKMQRRNDGENLRKGHPPNSPVDQSDPPENTIENKGLTQASEKSTTAEQLAAKHNVSPGTIKRDAQYAEAVDRLVSFLGPEFRRRLLEHKTGLTKKDVLALSAYDDRRLQHIADKKMDLKKCAKTKRRYLRENAPIQMEFAFIDTWRTRVAEARDALHNGDQDAVDTILAELIDELDKVKQKNAAR